MESPPPTCPRRWLVVDDDAAFAELIVLALLGIGIAQVERSSSPVEALARLEAAGGAFELVITELDMAELNGLELARKICARLPAVKVILVTTYADAFSHEKLHQSGVTAVLRKPFTVPQLDALVRSLTCEPPRENAG